MGQILRNRNELMQGASPECAEVLKNFDLSHAAYYTDGYYGSALASEVSSRFGLPRERVLVCYGGEDFLRTAFDSINSKTDSVLTHEYYYTYYKTYLEGRGATLHTFKMRDDGDAFSFDIEDCIAQYKQHQPKVVLIASPNSPTGNTISPAEFERILQTVTPETLVVLDEAYWGFDFEYDQQAFLNLLEKYPNLAILRSFSKYYGLAGLRVGFVLCGANVKEILNYQDLYLGMSRLLEEVAIAALKSEDYYNGVAKQIEQERERLISEIRKLKSFKAYDSKANLVFMQSDEGVTERLGEAWKDVRTLSAKRIRGNYWRITVGLPEVNDELIKVLTAIDGAE